jgi:hypothetical protein
MKTLRQDSRNLPRMYEETTKDIYHTPEGDLKPEHSEYEEVCYSLGCKFGEGCSWFYHLTISISDKLSLVPNPELPNAKHVLR